MGIVPIQLVSSESSAGARRLHEYAVKIADEPRYAIVRGLEQMFDEPLWLRRVIRGEQYSFPDVGSESL
jgi:hypothetical protein